MNKELLESLFVLRKNLIINGDLATGKTYNIMIPLVKKMIENDENLFIVDSHEEYINEIYDELQNKDYNILIFNLRDLSRSESWNPLYYPYKLYLSGNKDEACDLLDNIFKILYYDKDFDSSLISDSAIDLSVGIILSLFEYAKEEQINFNSLSYILNNNKSDLKKYFERFDKLDPAYIYASSSIYNDEIFDNVILTINKTLKSIVTRNKLSKMLNKNTFDISDILCKKTALILIGKDENKILNRLCSIFIEQLFNILVNEKNNYKYNFVIDKLDLFEGLNNLNNMLNSSHYNNVNFVIGTRQINQFNKKYGKNIPRLCDIVTIGNKKIELIINGVRHTKDKNFETITPNKANIIYPTLDDTKICVYKLNEIDNTKKNTNYSTHYEDSSNSKNYESYKLTMDAEEMIKTIKEKMHEFEENMLTEEENQDDEIEEILFDINSDDEIDEKETRVFEAHDGGFMVSTDYFYIDKLNDNYIFKYYNDKDGREELVESMMISTIKSKEEYSKFISTIKDMTKDWISTYDTSEFFNTGGWSISLFEDNIEYKGSIKHPDNFNEVMNYIKESFK